MTSRAASATPFGLKLGAGDLCLHVVAARPDEILPALKVLIAARVAECDAELRELGVTLDEESAA